MRVPLIFSLIHLLFSAPPASAQLYADCDSAFWIGTQYKLHFTGAYGIGNNAEEAKRVECFFNGENYGQAEENSTWLRFAIEKAGTLRFTIQPDSLGDDYDFVLYRLPADGQCSKKKTIRCMASGANPVAGKSGHLYQVLPFEQRKNPGCRNGTKTAGSTSISYPLFCR